MASPGGAEPEDGSDDENLRLLAEQLADERSQRQAAEADLTDVLRVVNSMMAVWRRGAAPLLRRRGFVSGEDDPPAQIV